MRTFTVYSTIAAGKSGGASLTIQISEFEDTAVLVTADEQGRVDLGNPAGGRTYVVSWNSAGQALLSPVKTLPESEDWLEKNPAALASVLRGIEDSRAGRVRERDFSAFANDEV